jgi:hemolysin activation/secretion protein
VQYEAVNVKLGFSEDTRGRSPSACRTGRQRTTRQVLSTTLVGLIWAVTARAQTNVPSPGQLVPKTFAPEERPAEPTLELPEPEREKKTSADRVQVNISRFALNDPDPELAALVDHVLSPLRNQRVPIENIYTAIAEVEQDYADRGHFLTRIVIPPQHLPDGGELRLTVIHGFIQWLDLDGIPAGSRARVASILASLVNNPNITRASFERAMLVANDMPTLNLKARLRPGPQDGSVILVLSGEYRAMTGQLAIDNSLPKLLGRTSATLSSAYTAESGPISQITMIASAPVTSDPISSNSPRSLLVGGLRSAVGVSGAALDADITWSRTKPTPTPRIIDTDSTYERASLRGSYPIVKTRATTLVAEAAFDATYEEETATQFGSRLYDDELRVLRLGLSVDHVFSVALQGSAGIDLSRGLRGLGSRGPADATADDPLSQVGASDVFTKWEWHGSLHRELPARTAVDLQVRGQQVDHPLLLSEKFTLGGPTDLSGYDTASFSGDRGWVVRGELQRHLDWHPGSMNTLAQAYVFGARGEVVMLQPTAAEQHTSLGSSAGIGMRTSSGRVGALIGPFDLTGELARQFNPTTADLPDHWRVNLSATAHF